MSMKVSLAFILLLLVMPALFSIDISSCQVINNPGEYDLVSNLSGRITVGWIGTCLYINTTNVSIDCHGYSIGSDGSLIDEAVYVNHNYKNISLENCIIQGDYSYGVYIQDGTEVSILNSSINISNSGVLDILFYGDNLSIFNSHLIHTGGGYGRGCIGADWAHDIRVENTTMSGDFRYSNLLKVLILNSPDGYLNMSNVTITNVTGGCSGLCPSVFLNSYIDGDLLMFTGERFDVPEANRVYNVSIAFSSESWAPVDIYEFGFTWSDSEIGSLNESRFEMWTNGTGGTLLSEDVNESSNQLIVHNLHIPQGSKVYVSMFESQYAKINSCLNITNPGKYRLVSDISCENISTPEVGGLSYTSIKISTSDVLFSCGGHTINGSLSFGRGGIAVLPALHNISVVDCNIDNKYTGIYSESSIQVNDTTMFNVNPYGFYFYPMFSVTIDLNDIYFPTGEDGPHFSLHDSGTEPFSISPMRSDISPYPSNRLSFNNYFVNITPISITPPNISSLTFTWDDDDLENDSSGLFYKESNLEVWEYNSSGVWLLMPFVLDRASNEISINNFVPHSVYAVLHNGSLVPPPYLYIDTPGMYHVEGVCYNHPYNGSTYLLEYNWGGGPIPVSVYTCVHINASNVTLICDDWHASFDDGGSNLTAGIVVEGGENITIIGCHVNNSTYGIVATNTSGLYIYNSTFEYLNLSNVSIPEYTGTTAPHAIHLFNVSNVEIANNHFSHIPSGAGIFVFYDSTLTPHVFNYSVHDNLFEHILIDPSGIPLRIEKGGFGIGGNPIFSPSLFVNNTFRDVIYAYYFSGGWNGGDFTSYNDKIINSKGGVLIDWDESGWGPSVYVVNLSNFNMSNVSCGFNAPLSPWLLIKNGVITLDNSSSFICAPTVAFNSSIGIILSQGYGPVVDNVSVSSIGETESGIGVYSQYVENSTISNFRGNALMSGIVEVLSTGANLSNIECSFVSSCADIVESNGSIDSFITDISVDGLVLLLSNVTLSNAAIYHTYRGVTVGSSTLMCNDVNISTLNISSYITPALFIVNNGSLRNSSMSCKNITLFPPYSVSGHPVRILRILDNDTISDVNISWDYVPFPLPENMISIFNFVNITQNDSLNRFDELTFKWLPSDVSSLADENISLWMYDALGWTLLNDTPDTSNRLISIFNFIPQSDYGLLVNNSTTSSPPSPPPGGGGEEENRIIYSFDKECVYSDGFSAYAYLHFHVYDYKGKDLDGARITVYSSESEPSTYSTYTDDGAALIKVPLGEAHTTDDNDPYIRNFKVRISKSGYETESFLASIDCWKEPNITTDVICGDGYAQIKMCAYDPDTEEPINGIGLWFDSCTEDGFKSIPILAGQDGCGLSRELYPQQTCIIYNTFPYYYYKSVDLNSSIVISCPTEEETHEGEGEEMICSLILDAPSIAYVGDVIDVNVSYSTGEDADGVPVTVIYPDWSTSVYIVENGGFSYKATVAGEYRYSASAACPIITDVKTKVLAKQSEEAKSTGKAEKKERPSLVTALTIGGISLLLLLLLIAIVYYLMKKRYVVKVLNPMPKPGERVDIKVLSRIAQSPVKSVAMFVYKDGMLFSKGTTNKYGRYSFVPDTPGRYTIFVGSDQSETRVEVVVSEE